MDRATAGSTGDVPSARRRRAVWRRPGLAIEITAALLVKVALITAIKLIFFSHPMEDGRAAAALSHLLAAGTEDQASPVQAGERDRTEPQ
jgi:hypothetical protein